MKMFRLNAARRAAVCALAAAGIGCASASGHAQDMNGQDMNGMSDHSGMVGMNGTSGMGGPDGMSGMHSGMSHGTIPAGVSGATMVGQGQVMMMYMPMFMQMDGNYDGTDRLSTKEVLATPNPFAGMPMPGMPMMTQPKDLRIVPNQMSTQMHMFGTIYGITNDLNFMIMGNYTHKDMTMTTYNMMGTAIGKRTNSTEGFGDLQVSGLYRIYEDSINHIHLNLGLSLPTGSTTEQMSMLSPMGMLMTMRAMYGMELGTGTVDFMPGLTYTAKDHEWSWGASYRGRFALDDNPQGYHWGDNHELSSWLGYTFIPGVTATGRIAGTITDKIQGMDPKIMGPMEGTYPGFYGGERIDLFGGLAFAGRQFGLGDSRLAVEGGAPVYQDLNGPQLGRDWQINVALGVGF